MLLEPYDCFRFESVLILSKYFYYLRYGLTPFVLKTNFYGIPLVSP